MKFKIENCHDKKLKERLGEAIRFYTKQLLHPNLSRRLFVTVRINCDMDRSEWAECYPSHVINDKPRKFTIRISKKAQNIMLVLAHEMIHLKQYAKQELAVCHTKWKNRFVDEERIKYLDLPWEKEAHKNDYELYQKFIHEIVKTQ